MRPLLLEAMHRQANVFSAAQAKQAGIGWDELDGLCARGELVRVRQGVFTLPAMWDVEPAERHRIEVAAAMLKRGVFDGGPLRFVAGHRSAACLWGFELPWAVVGKPRRESTALMVAGGEDERPAPADVDLVSIGRGSRTYRARVGVHPAQLPDSDIAMVGGVPVTSLARTAVDLMRESSRNDAKIIADQALRLGCAHADLVELAQRCSRWRGGRQAVELSPYADGRAQSAAESIARHLARENGLPAATPQFEIRDSRGRRRKLDLAFVGQWTDWEQDGKRKYRQPWRNPQDVLWEEKLREDSVREVGWEVVRSTWHQLIHEPERVIAQLQAAFDRGRLRHAS